ncbi:MAG: carbonic anhydrase [Pirellulales bacterium]|nr:carbonic anhydrase [Pirellulales bacterium]
MLTPTDAIARLKEGNQRYVSGQPTAAHRDPARRSELATGQSPWAIVLSCADSRVPPEVVFDQGLGDLFVVRVAGNIVTPALLGSIEFAAAEFGARLIVVLGHSQCGAVKAVLGLLDQPVESVSPNLQAIADEILPVAKPLHESDLRGSGDQLVAEAVRANVRNTADRLKSESAVVASLAEEDGLVIVGAEYSLETGVVDLFFDGENSA